MDALTHFLHPCFLQNAKFGPEDMFFAGVVTLAVRLPDGKRLVRRFRSSDSVNMILSFVQSQGTDAKGLELQTAFPAKVGAHELEKEQ